MEKEVTKNFTHSVAFSDTASRDTIEPNSHSRITSPKLNIDHEHNLVSCIVVDGASKAAARRWNG
jgi:hypothetical protein